MISGDGAVVSEAVGWRARRRASKQPATDCTISSLVFTPVTRTSSDDAATAAARRELLGRIYIALRKFLAFFYILKNEVWLFSRVNFFFFLGRGLTCF